LHADLTTCGYKYDSSGRLVLESKQDIKKRAWRKRAKEGDFNRPLRYPPLGMA